MTKAFRPMSSAFTSALRAWKKAPVTFLASGHSVTLSAAK